MEDRQREEEVVEDRRKKIWFQEGSING